MKTSRYIYVAAIICCLLMTSCVKDKRADSQVYREEQTLSENTSQDSAKKDSVKTGTIKQDSVTKDTTNVSKEGTNSDSMATIQTPYVTNAEQERDDVLSIWVIISLVLGIFSIIICAIIWKICSHRFRDYDFLLKESEHETDKKLMNANRQVLNSEKVTGESMIKLQQRFDEFEERLRKLERIPRNSTIRNQNGSVETSPQTNAEAIQRYGYFGMVKAGNGLAIFNDYPKSRNEDAFFEVTYIDEEHCEFAPFNLDKIRSVDAITSAVDYKGSMAYAKDMRVLKKGTAVFDSERNFWKITNKAIIDLIA